MQSLKSAWLLCAILLALFPAAAQAAAKKRLASFSPCPNFEISGELDPPLNDTELRLICGDPKSQAWRTIPAPQAVFNLRNFLQARGYHHPKIHTEGDFTWVEIGSQTLLTELTEEGAPEGLRLNRKRDIQDKPLTPQLLTLIEQWTLQRVQALGHPCPTVSTRADPRTGRVHLTIDPGPRQLLESITEEPIQGVLPGVMRRYDALRLGDPFNGDWLAITTDRINAQDIVQNVHFTPKCGPLGAVVHQDTTPGPPRLLSFGFGINTEGLLQGRASWRHTRLGDAASWLDVTGLFTTREQRVEGQFNWYHLPYPSRRSIRPSLRFRHQNETFFETLEGRARLAYATSWDGKEMGFNFLAGPSFRQIRTFRGVGPTRAHFVFLEFEGEMRSHEFEYFARDPRSGVRFNAVANLGSRSVFSSVSAQRVGFSGELLYNFRDFDPPLFVIGFRSSIDATFTSERADVSTGLPANFFHFLGGSSDLRGFGREELPKSGIGGLTSAYAGAELRVNALLPPNWQPFIFFDVGALGFRPLRIEKPIYYSPGFGLRWASPVGAFRTSLAHGLPRDIGHWQFYFSFGEEF